MKKILCFFLCFVLLFLFACQSGKPPKIKEGISADVDLSFSDKEGGKYILSGKITGDLNKRVCSFCVETPDELSSLSFSFAGECEISLENLSVRTKSSLLPKNSPVEVLYRVLCHLPQGAECKGKEEGLWVFEGCTEGTCYKALLNDDGYVVKISSEELNLLAEFSYGK